MDERERLHLGESLVPLPASLWMLCVRKPEGGANEMRLRRCVQGEEEEKALLLHENKSTYLPIDPIYPPWTLQTAGEYADGVVSLYHITLDMA
eukprot:superscaffoldBa00001345_g10165